MRAPTTWLLVSLAIALSAYAAPASARGPAVPVRCPSWHVSFGGGAIVCYGRQAFAEAAARLPFTPIDPSAAVKRLTRLSLTSIALTSGPGPQLHKPLVGIQLVYGRVPAQGFTMPAARKPVYLIVGEGHGMEAHPGGLSRSVEWSGGQALYGEWTYDGAIPARHIVFSIESNARRAVVLAAAHAIERAGK